MTEYPHELPWQEQDASPEECMESCMHHKACRALLGRLGAGEYGDRDAALAMGCDDCDQWEERL